MKRAILVHGYYSQRKVCSDPGTPTPSNDHWLPWLSKQLYMNKIFPITIEMPKPWYPVYEDWKKELDRFEPDEDTILIGHSYGGGFLIRYLSENDVKVGKVFLAAPYMGVEFAGSPADAQDMSFFRFEIDKNLPAKIGELTVFGSTTDMQEIKDSVAILEKNVAGVNVKTIKNAGHFRAEDGYAEFPELLEEILR